MTGGATFSTALTGMGAVAIGLNLGTGIRLARLHIRRLVPALVTVVIAISIGMLGFPLLHVLAVMLPVSLALAWLGQRS
jgi:chromate transporter